MGKDGAHRRLTVRKAGGEGAEHNVIWFGGADVELVPGPLDLVYTLSVNEFRGERSLQLMYVAHRPAQAVTTPARALPAAPKIVDLRRYPTPEQYIPANAVWYAEGTLLDADGNHVPFAPRQALASAAAGTPLVVWSAPPSPELLRWMVATVAPAQLFLCVRATSTTACRNCCATFLGMCKFALAQDGMLDVARMAARIGMTESLMRKALLWLDAAQRLRVLEWGDGDFVHIRTGYFQHHEELVKELQEEVRGELYEVRAYRRFLQTVPVKDLDL